jgi:multiple sugar transport system ATP-binding protein
MIEMNVIQAKIARKNDKRILDTGIGEITLPITPQLSGSEILVGIRPEHIHIGEEGGHPYAGNIFTFEGRVKISEVIGSETIIHLDVGLAEPIRILIPTIYKKNPGEVLRATFNIKDVYLFNANGQFICRGGSILG